MTHSDSTRKRCTQCHRDLPLSAFDRSPYPRSDGPGLSRLYRKCRECRVPKDPDEQEIPPPNPSGLCQCGCGGITAIATESSRRRGNLRGHHVRFLPHHHTRLQKRTDPMYVVDPETGCWNWQWAQSPRGYGLKWVGRSGMMAHRWMYLQVKGSIPDGLTLDHLCKNKLCVNPDHLEPVTTQENTRRHYASAPLSPTCKHGHPLEGDNLKLYTAPNGHTWRRCRTCERRWAATSRKRRMHRRDHGATP